MTRRLTLGVFIQLDIVEDHETAKIRLKSFFVENFSTSGADYFRIQVSGKGRTKKSENPLLPPLVGIFSSRFYSVRRGPYWIRHCVFKNSRREIGHTGGKSKK